MAHCPFSWTRENFKINNLSLVNCDSELLISVLAFVCCRRAGEAAQLYVDHTGHSDFALCSYSCGARADTNRFSSGQTTQDDVESLFFFFFHF